MKKITSYLLALLLIVSFIIPTSYSPAHAAGEVPDSERAEKLLYDLGIIGSDFNAESLVTRGEFCSYLCKLLDISHLVPTVNLPYTDVDSSNKYYNSIAILYEWEIISASATFRPDDIILPSEAAKMAVVTLSYSFLAEAKGGYPFGYVAAANSLDISVASEINGAVAANILYDMLHCQLPAVSIVNSEFTYSLRDGSTLLEKVWGLSKLNGMLTDGQYFGMNLTNGAGYGYAVVGGYSLKSGKFDTDSLFGENVDVYYDKNTYIRSIYSYNDSNNYTLYSVQNITYNNNVYEYDGDNEKRESIALSKTASIVYNGKSAPFDQNRMVPSHGYVKLICTKSNIADIVVIKDYTEFVAGDIVEEEFLVSDKLNIGEFYNLEADTLTISNQDGDIVGFGDIADGDIIWLAKSIDGDLIDVTICKDMIVGEYNASSQGSSYVYIDGGEFVLTSYALNQINNKEFNLGEVIVAYLNPDGEVVYIEPAADSTERSYGYLIESTLSGSGLAYEIYVKILNTDGEIVTLRVADKFKINMIAFTKDTVTNYNNLYKQPEKPSSMHRGLIAFYTNDDGDITTINYGDNIASKFGGRSLDLYKNSELDVYDDTSAKYKKNGYWIIAKSPQRVFMKTSTIMFNVPRDEDVNKVTDEDYSITLVSTLATNTALNKMYHIGYSTIKDEDVCDYVVSEFKFSETAGSVATASPLYLVTSISQGLDENGYEKAILRLKGVNDKDHVYYSDDLNYFENLGLKFGDAIKLAADSRKNIEGILVVYRAGDKKFTNESTFSVNKYIISDDDTLMTSSTSTQSLATSYMVIGNVYSKGGQLVKVLKFNTDPADYTNEVLHTYSLKSIKFTICNLETETFEYGDIADVKTFKDFGTECSVALVETNGGNIDTMFIYK